MPTIPSTLTSAEQLKGLLDAIPIANDGDVIAPDYHNTLRAAFSHLAHTLDVSQTAAVVTRSFPPTMWPLIDKIGPGAPAIGEWQSFICYARPTQDTTAGWMPVELPDGTRIDAVTLRGQRGPGKFAEWSFALLRLELSGFQFGGAGYTNMCNGKVPKDLPQGAGDSVVVTVGPDVAGLTTTQANELVRVDNSKYRYVFQSVLTAADVPSEIQLHLAQVTCTRPTT